LFGKKIATLRKRTNLEGFLFVGPWLVGFILLGAYPFFYSLFLAFNKWNIVGEAQWVGLENFRRMLDMTRATGTEFVKSLQVTFYYTFVSIPLTVVWSITLALLLRRRIRGQRIYISFFYLPSVISGVSIALMWRWVFNSRHGLANALLKLIGIQGPRWFLHTSTAVPAFILMSLWNMGFMLVVYLGALQNIPKEIEESADLDGVGPFRKLFGIILPMISPVIFYQVIMGIIGSFQVFVSAYVISGGGEVGGVSLGGPKDAFLFYVLNIYKYGFVYLKMGFASALAWILFIIILAFTFLAIKASPLWVFYRGGEGE
jgi:multiple sugar transport system permease protein